jgi:hypothetical protein
VPYDDPGHWPSPSTFGVCSNHGCNRVSHVSLTGKEWQRATQPLTESLTGPVGERRAIAESIARLEQVTGKYAGTANDKGENLRGFGEPGQMDCIDESTNTTTYLRMIEVAGFLQWHEVPGTRTRFGIRAGFPHTTAIIREKDTGALYAVDSWFHDNGEKPVIVEYRKWKSGWSPDDD